MLALASSLSDLPFRGSRNYLHSTDLYAALNDFVHQQFPADTFIENLTLRRTVDHQVRVSFDDPSGSFASFRVQHGIDHIKGWLVETNAPVLHRIAFDEVTATQAATTGCGFAIFQKLLPNYSPFELLFILTKIISTQHYAEHWLICQIEFRSPLCELAPLECRLTRKISDRYLTVDIYQAGQPIGSAVGVAALGPA